MRDGCCWCVEVLFVFFSYCVIRFVCLFFHSLIPSCGISIFFSFFFTFHSVFTLFLSVLVVFPRYLYKGKLTEQIRLG